MKHHRGTARAEDWVLAEVERETNRCLIVPCPEGKRTAANLLFYLKASKEFTLPTSINKYWSYIAPFLGYI